MYTAVSEHVVLASVFCYLQVRVLFRRRSAVFDESKRRLVYGKVQFAPSTGKRKYKRKVTIPFCEQCYNIHDTKRVIKSNNE